MLIPWLQKLLSTSLPTLSPEYRVLLTVPHFTGDRIGAIAETPAHLFAWRELLSHKAAATYFSSLVAHATVPGQLYGLAGLYYADPTRLETLVPPYLEREDRVQVMITCVVGAAAVREIAERIVDGAWPEALRRGAPGLRDWPPWCMPAGFSV